MNCARPSPRGNPPTPVQSVPAFRCLHLERFREGVNEPPRPPTVARFGGAGVTTRFRPRRPAPTMRRTVVHGNVRFVPRSGKVPQVARYVRSSVLAEHTRLRSVPTAEVRICYRLNESVPEVVVPRRPACSLRHLTRSTGLELTVPADTPRVLLFATHVQPKCRCSSHLHGGICSCYRVLQGRAT